MAYIRQTQDKHSPMPNKTETLENDLVIAVCNCKLGSHSKFDKLYLGKYTYKYKDL